MESGTFYIGASSDDGYFTSSALNIDATYVRLGASGVVPYNGFFRFPSVTIPAGATITSAFVRFYAQATLSGTTVNLICYFNDADDAVAPVEFATADGLDLTTGVAWDNLGAWTDNSTYDTPSLVSSLQEVIDRAGWASGQAVMLVVRNNSSSSYRNASAIDLTTNQKAALYVEWSMELAEDLTIMGVAGAAVLGINSPAKILGVS